MEQRADAAEEVRAYLVAIRGGAPFLSGADGRILLDWLDQGVPVPLILCCIDRIAARRQKTHSRSRLTLARCKSEVRKTWGALPPPKAEAAPESAPGMAAPPLRRALEELAMEIEEDPHNSSELEALRAELVTGLRALAARDGLALEPAATEAMRLCRLFHEQAWDQHSGRDALVEAAQAELASLQAVLDDGTWAALVDESARARLRTCCPQVSADKVWDTLKKASMT